MKRSFSASAAPTRIAKSEILKNVTFSISGLQNPKRDQIRNVALSLGATYVPDLSAVSTPSKDRHKQPSRLHLLLSPFEVTPKSDELVRSRHPGAVVVPDYVVQCAERGERLGLDRFALWVGGDGVDDAIARFMKGDGAGGNIGTAARGRSHASDFPRQRGAEERQLEEDGDHGDWVPTTRRVPSRSDGAAPATRFGSEAKKARMEKGSSGGGGHGLARLSDKLNDCLKGVVVSFDGEMPLPDVMVLRRYVMACGGDWVIDQPQDATILCTHRGTRRELPKAAQSFGIVVRPAWITACWNEQTLQDYVPFEVV
ncbi:hypothetical protein DFJ73DRAFT_498567 [Zopfochytrium polystomum]|nr:hypothetical protein DFJ73DRAFT_498567 [Zopfochytrium polystomum]